MGEVWFLPCFVNIACKWHTFRDITQDDFLQWYSNSVSGLQETRGRKGGGVKRHGKEYGPHGQEGQMGRDDEVEYFEGTLSRSV